MIGPAHPVVVLLDDEDVRIPGDAHALAEFRRWSHSEQFPERGRIDYLNGGIEVDMSLEDLYSHGTVKVAIASRLHTLVAEQGRGHVFVGRARVVSPDASLSVEPDVVVVLWESLDAGLIREVPSSPPQPGRYVELEGAPDLVVEVVSRSSVGKDRKRLPVLYARAGVPELWLVDARGETPVFEVWSLKGSEYAQVAPDDEAAGGWTASPVLGRRCRLRRRMSRADRFVYDLELFS
jgi:Uma2 family endonuclease